VGIFSKDEGYINVVCPQCEHENSIKLESEGKCSKCDCALHGRNYVEFTWSLSGKFLLIVGGCAGYFINDYVERNRYPIWTEYKIVEQCVHSSREALFRKVFNEKEKVCVCALKKTQKKFNYSKFREDPNSFMSLFSSSVNDCL